MIVASLAPSFSSNPARTDGSVSLEPRTMPVPAAVAAAQRPPDVAQAAAEYSYTGPHVPGVSIADARRAQELVHAAMATMPLPRIQVNRQLDNAEAILRSDAPFPTMFDQPVDKRPGDYDTRRGVEQAFNIYGRGPQEGRTVYGSVQFADRFRFEPNGPDHRNFGVSMYGPVSMVLKPQTWNRATVLPSDSYFLEAQTNQPGGVENLADIATDRLVRSMSPDWFGTGTTPLQQLVTRPHRSAITQVKRALTSATMLNNGGMMEAAIRGVDRSDIAEIRVLRQKGLGPLDDLDRGIRRLRYHAKKLGIPVHQETVG